MITEFRSRLEQTFIIGEMKTLGIRWHSQPASWFSMQNGLVSKYTSVPQNIANPPARDVDSLSASSTSPT